MRKFATDLERQSAIVGDPCTSRPQSIDGLESLRRGCRLISIYFPRKRFRPIRHRFAVGTRALRTWRTYKTDGTRAELLGAS